MKTNSMQDLYDRLLGQIYDRMRQADQAFMPSLKHLVEESMETLEELGEYSEAELHKAADHLKKDFQHLSEETEILKHWADLDLEMLEEEGLSQLLKAADPTRVEWDKLLHRQALADDDSPT